MGFHQQLDKRPVSELPAPGAPHGGHARRATLVALGLAALCAAAVTVALTCAPSLPDSDVTGEVGCPSGQGGAPGVGDAPVDASGDEDREGEPPGSAAGTPPDPGVVEEVGEPQVCREAGSLVSTARNGMGAKASWKVGLGLQQAATRILEEMEDTGALTLHRAEYLDLFQEVWACVATSGQGWAQVVIVDERGGGEGECTVTVVRIGQDAIEAAHASAGADAQARPTDGRA